MYCTLLTYVSRNFMRLSQGNSCLFKWLVPGVPRLISIFMLRIFKQRVHICLIILFVAGGTTIYPCRKPSITTSGGACVRMTMVRLTTDLRERRGGSAFPQIQRSSSWPWSGMERFSLRTTRHCMAWRFLLSTRSDQLWTIQPFVHTLPFFWTEVCFSRVVR